MNRVILFLITLYISCGFLYAKENLDYYFKQGNAYYETKDYDNAIAMYEKILTRNKESGEIYYNIGNCYFRKQDYGRAMLYYIRAKKLIPDSKDLNHNIKIINTLYIKDKIENTRWWILTIIDYIVSRFNMRTWIVLLISFYILTCLFIIFHIKRFRNPITVVFICVFLLSSYKYYNDYYIKKGVIIENNISVLSGPQDEYDKLFTLNAGSIAKVMEHNNGWMRVRLANGLEGWIVSSAIKQI